MEKSILNIQYDRNIDLVLSKEMLSTVVDTGIAKIKNLRIIGVSTLEMNTGTWVIEESSIINVVSLQGDEERFLYISKAREARNWEIENEKLKISILILSVLGINLLVSSFIELLR
jgi:hypothetical protein